MEGIEEDATSMMGDYYFIYKNIKNIKRRVGFIFDMILMFLDFLISIPWVHTTQRLMNMNRHDRVDTMEIKTFFKSKFDLVLSVHSSYDLLN